jgi:hypothetical protein
MVRIDKEQGGMWTPKPREATYKRENAKKHAMVFALDAIFMNL